MLFLTFIKYQSSKKQKMCTVYMVRLNIIDTFEFAKFPNHVQTDSRLSLKDFQVVLFLTKSFLRLEAQRKKSQTSQNSTIAINYFSNVVFNLESRSIFNVRIVERFLFKFRLNSFQQDVIVGCALCLSFVKDGKKTLMLMLKKSITVKYMGLK